MNQQILRLPWVRCEQKRKKRIHVNKGITGELAYAKFSPTSPTSSFIFGWRPDYSPKKLNFVVLPFGVKKSVPSLRLAAVFAVSSVPPNRSGCVKCVRNRIKKTAWHFERLLHFEVNKEKKVKQLNVVKFRLQWPKPSLNFREGLLAAWGDHFTPSGPFILLLYKQVCLSWPPQFCFVFFGSTIWNLWAHCVNRFLRPVWKRTLSQSVKVAFNDRGIPVNQFKMPFTAEGAKRYIEMHLRYNDSSDGLFAIYDMWNMFELASSLGLSSPQVIRLARKWNMSCLQPQLEWPAIVGHPCVQTTEKLAFIVARQTVQKKKNTATENRFWESESFVLFCSTLSSIGLVFYSLFFFLFWLEITNVEIYGQTKTNKISLPATFPFGAFGPKTGRNSNFC